MRWWVVLLLTGCRQYYGMHDPELARDGATAGDGTDPDDVASDVTPVDASLAALCPVDYSLISASGGRYRLFANPVDWIDAQPDCADDATPNLGVYTHLAVFATDAERASVNGLLNTTVWIGMSQRVTTGQWKWVTLESTGTYPPITTPPWAPNEPDGPDCGAMDENGRLEARQCDGPDDVKFVCECDFYPDTPGQY